MRTKLSLLAAPLLLAIAPAYSAPIVGSMGIAENACVESIYGTFLGANCSFSGGANVASAAGKTWIGPLDGGGFYSSVAAAPAFTFNTSTELDDAGVPLSSFLINNGSSAGDGKTAPSLSVNLSLAGSTISGTLTIGSGVRVASTGSSLAGSKAVVESFTSIVHTIVPKAADSVIGLNPWGGSDYIYGVVGFPANNNQCTGGFPFGVSDCFGSEMGASVPMAPSPWQVAFGGSGKNGFDGAPAGSTYIDIVSFDTGAFAGFFDNSVANIGVSSTSVINGGSCLDTGLDPQEPGPIIDTMTDCQDSAVAWTVGSNADFDNMVMKVSTDGGGNIVIVQSYYTNEYNIAVGQPGNNAWQGGYFKVSTVPVPAAVWLLGSALGLLGWMRRRATV